jgi:hypothetical protein
MDVSSLWALWIGQRPPDKLQELDHCVPVETDSLISSRIDRVSDGRCPTKPAGESRKASELFVISSARLLNQIGSPDWSTSTTPCARQSSAPDTIPARTSAELNRICKWRARSRWGARSRMHRRLSPLKTRPSSQSAAINLRPIDFDPGDAEAPCGASNACKYRWAIFSPIASRTATSFCDRRMLKKTILRKRTISSRSFTTRPSLR